MSAPPPTVGFVLHSAARDGAGVSFLELLDGLSGAWVRVAATLPADGPLAPEVRRRAAPAAIVPYRWWLDRGTPLPKRVARTAWNVAMATPLAARLRGWRCRAVVSNTIAVGAGALAAALLRLPHVWQVHELWGGETGLEFDLGERRSLRLVGRLSAACIAASGAIRDRLVAAGVDAARVHVIYQAVSVRPGEAAAVERSSGSLACVLVGGVFPLKRQADAVRAVAEAGRRGARLELWLVGEEHAGYGDEVRQLAGSVGAAVRFFGAVADVAPLVRAADVLLSCSAVEGFGRSVVEGMLLGKAVVAAAGGAVAELVEDGVTGLTFAPGDVGALAGHLERLAAHPEERRRLGEAARSRANGAFTRERYAREVAVVLGPLIAQRGR